MISSWNPDYRDLLDCLSAEDVEYLVVGAFAVAVHGLPRATGDIDVWVRPTDDNAARVYRALVRFGAPVATSQVSAADFARPGIVYQLGIAPRRIDFLTEVSGLTFEEAWKTRSELSIDGRKVWFLGLSALLQNKRAAGRLKDLADVEALERLHPKR